MSGDDPFGDLDQEMGEAMDGAEAEEEGDGATEPETEPESEPAPPMETPAFEFEDDTKQTPTYPHEDTAEDLQDFFDLQVENALRLAGLKNVAGREIHDAAWQVVMENPEAVKRRLVERRGLDPADVLDED